MQCRPPWRIRRREGRPSGHLPGISPKRPVAQDRQGGAPTATRRKGVVTTGVVAKLQTKFYHARGYHLVPRLSKRISTCVCNVARALLLSNKGGAPKCIICDERRHVVTKQQSKVCNASLAQLRRTQRTTETATTEVAPNECEPVLVTTRGQTTPFRRVGFCLPHRSWHQLCAELSGIPV